MRNRSWLIRETGEVRQAKESEFYLYGNMIFQCLLNHTNGTFSILKLTELFDESPQMGFDEWW